MESSTTKIGKVNKINKEKIGEIITPDEIYLFQMKDALDTIQKGDLVKFRAEEIHNQKKAFFIKKITNSQDLTIHSMKDSIYKPEQKEEES